MCGVIKLRKCTAWVKPGSARLLLECGAEVDRPKESMDSDSNCFLRGGHSRSSKENLKTFLVTVLGLVGGAPGGTETIHRISIYISEFF